MTSHKDVEAALKERLRELTGRAETIEDDLHHPLDADSSEQAVDLADDESLIGVDDVIRQEIGQIKAALARIRSGSYGLCAACGEQIGPERLRVLPTALRCIKCAAT